MKYFVRIAFLVLLLPINCIHAACLIRCCLSTEEEPEVVVENENTPQKRNRNMPKDIEISLKNNNSKSYRRYLDANNATEQWTLDTAAKNDPFVTVRSTGIKSTRDTRPMTWQNWEIEGKAAGFSTLILRKFVDDKQAGEEKITVTVID